MPRAFIAIHIEPPAALLKTLHAIRALDGPIKTVEDHNLHITLRFLGDTDESQFPDLIAAMRQACEGCGPFTMELKGLGAFPRIERPSVAWVGVEQEEPLRVIVNRLNPLIDALNFGGDHRPWNPHLTLARIKAKPPGELLDMLRDRRDTPFGSVAVTQINLMKSTLTPKGPIYDVIHRVAL